MRADDHVIELRKIVVLRSVEERVTRNGICVTCADARLG